MREKIKGNNVGKLHEIPDDLKSVLDGNSVFAENWSKLIPLAQNEWVCWVTYVKKEETRKKHIERLRQEVIEGKKRPCCWAGCPHRNPNSQKWFKK